MSDPNPGPSRNAALERQLGGRPFPVVMRLLLLSILVGAILYFANLSPIGLIEGIRAMITGLLGSGVDAVIRVGEFALYGAVIVVPIWLIGRLISSRRSG
jgi:Family of unknown function (DUF6460)